MPYDSFTALFSDFDSIEDTSNVESYCAPKIAPTQPTPSEQPDDMFARFANRSSVRRCAFCGDEMPADRQAAPSFGKGRPFKYCSDACGNDYNAALRRDKITTKNYELTNKLATLMGSARDEFLLNLVIDYIRFRIGYFTDRTQRNLMRRQSEAVSNAFMFGGKYVVKSNVFKVFIAFMREECPEIKDSIYDAKALLEFARKKNLVSADFNRNAPALINFNTATPTPTAAAAAPAAAPATTASIPTPANDIQSVEATPAPPQTPAPADATSHTKPHSPRSRIVPTTQIIEETPTKIDPQQFFSALLTFAHEENKKQTWVDWQYKEQFGKYPNSLVRTPGIITDQFLSIIKKCQDKARKKLNKPTVVSNSKEDAVIAMINAGSNMVGTMVSILPQRYPDLFADGAEVVSVVDAMIENQLVNSRDKQHGFASWALTPMNKKKAA